MTDTLERLTLGWGCRHATYGESANAVWGARLIAPADLVPNRQDLKYRTDDAKQELIEWLNGVPTGTGAIHKALEYCRDHYGWTGDFTGDSDKVFTLYESDKGIIIGSAQMSGGYVYVTGWLK